MLNQVVIVGRLARIPEEIILGENKKGLSITLAVLRSYKNEEGMYDTDFISALCLRNIGEQVLNYCKVGDLVGVKGRLEVRNDLNIIAERLTFLSSNNEVE